MKKITISIILTVALLASLLCVSVLTAGANTAPSCAEDGCSGSYENGFCTADGTHYEAATLNDGGTELDLNDDYYEIANAGQLYWFAAKVNGGSADINAKLTANITVNEGVLNADGALNGTPSIAWTPIGEDHDYQGTFDGQGHTISGIYCVQESSSAGLFFVVDTYGVVKNLGLLDSYFSGGPTVGSIAVVNIGKVQNCFSMATIYGNTNNSYTNNFGGLVGNNTGMLENSYFAGAISFESSPLVHAGGVAGQVDNEKTARNCYFDSTKYSGEAVGHQFNDSIVENVAGKAAAEFADGTVRTLLGSGWVQGTGDAYPVICIDAEHDQNGIYTPDVEDSGKHDLTYSCCGIVITHTYENGFCSCGYQPAVLNGVGANGAPLYEISNAGQLYWFAELVNTGAQIAGMDTPADTADDLYTYHLNARLMADITVNPGVFGADGSYTSANGETLRSWVPIGGVKYYGDFDGNCKTVSGLFQSGSGPSNVGFIGRGMEGHVLHHLGITNSMFANGSYLGSFYAYQAGGKLQDCWSDAILRGSESLWENTGGFAGKLYGTVENSFFFGVILASDNEPMNHPYGVSGNLPDDGVIVNSYSTLGEGAWKIDAADLASGKLAVLLANKDVRSIWGQTLGSDAHPTLLGPVVYANVPVNCTQVGYSNNPVGSTAHLPAGAWSSDGTHHWHACTVEGCDEKLDLHAHAHDNDCDADCNVCAAERTVAHRYDNDCDATCNICGAERSVAAHADADGNNACDTCASFVEGGLSFGAGIGIGTGAAVLVLVGGFLLFWFVLKKRK